MQRHKKMVAGNRIIIMLLFPVLVLLWSAGWILFCAGLRLQEAQETGERSVALTGIVLEEFEKPKNMVPYSADSVAL